MGTFFDWMFLMCAIFAGIATTLLWVVTCKETGKRFDSFMVVVILLFTVVGGLIGTGMSILFESFYNDYISQKNDSVPVVESSIVGEVYEQLEILITNGYSLYLNGESIDTKDFNIYDYPEENYYINNERKEIYLKN